MAVLEVRSRLPFPAGEVFAWHARRGSLERLLPPWERIEIEKQPDGLSVGDRFVLRIRKGPVTLRWNSVITELTDGVCFADRMEKGPFRFWQHTHTFETPGPSESNVVDRVEYHLPMGALGNAFMGQKMWNDLNRMFAFRHERTRRDLLRHARYASSGPLRIAITGSTGMIGCAVTAFLRSAGHTVHRMLRRPSSGDPGEIAWDPRGGTVEAEKLEGCDAVIHLAGESLMGRWTDAKKDRIYRSRVDGTATLATALAGLTRKPEVFISASAVGYYGSRGDEILTEESGPGQGFLRGVCQDWESAAVPAREAGIRVVNARMAMVVTSAGGGLAAMLPPFQLGLGGRIGTGRQYMSWISLDDVLGAIEFLLHEKSHSGPVNLASPNPVTNEVFAKTLGRVLGRPTILPVPATALKAAMGEMSEEMLLCSQRVISARLSQAGFVFHDPDLESCLRYELGRMGS